MYVYTYVPCSDQVNPHVPPCPRSVEWSPSHVAHQLPGDAGRVSSTQTLSTRPKRSPCVGASRHPVEAGAEAREMDASPWGGEADMESFGPGSGGSVCDSSDIALSLLVISDSSSSAGAGCYGTDLAEASSARLSPIALLTGVLKRLPRDGVHLLLKPCSGRAEYGSRTWFLSSMALHGGFPLRRDLLSLAEGMIFHPCSDLWKMWVWPLRGHNS